MGGKTMYPYDFEPKVRGIKKEMIFVVMPFSDAFDVLFTDLIEPATGYANKLLEEESIKWPQLTAFRTKDDMRTTSGWINILENLTTAQIVLGVLTSDNPNVLYELGIAHATQQISRQVLLASNVYKPIFDTKDLIFHRYDDDLLFKSIEPLAKKIADAIKTYSVENEMKVLKARGLVNPYGFDVLMNRGITRNFGLKVSEEGKAELEKEFGKGAGERHINGVSNLQEIGLLAFNTATRPKPGMLFVEFSYWWTPLGNEVLCLLGVIQKEAMEKRNSQLPRFLYSY